MKYNIFIVVMIFNSLYFFAMDWPETPKQIESLGSLALKKYMTSDDFSQLLEQLEQKDADKVLEFIQHPPAKLHHVIVVNLIYSLSTQKNKFSEKEKLSFINELFNTDLPISPSETSKLLTESKKILSRIPAETFPLIAEINKQIALNGYESFTLNLKDPFTNKTFGEIARAKAEFGLPLLVARVVVQDGDQKIINYCSVDFFQLLYDTDFPLTLNQAENRKFGNIPLKKEIKIFSIAFDYEDQKTLVIQQGSDLDILRGDQRLRNLLLLNRMSSDITSDQLAICYDAARELLFDEDLYVRAAAQYIYAKLTLANSQNKFLEQKTLVTEYGHALRFLFDVSSQNVNPYAKAAAEFELYQQLINKGSLSKQYFQQRSFPAGFKQTLLTNLSRQNYNMLLNTRARYMLARTMQNEGDEEAAERAFKELASEQLTSPTKKAVSLLEMALRYPEDAPKYIQQALKIPKSLLITEQQKTDYEAISNQARALLFSSQDQEREIAHQRQILERQDKATKEKLALESKLSLIQDMIGADLFNSLKEEQQGNLKRELDRAMHKNKELSEIQELLKAKAEEMAATNAKLRKGKTKIRS